LFGHDQDQARLMDKHDRCGTSGALKKLQERPNRRLILPAPIAIIAPPPGSENDYDR
jgi:hypothetical protein